MKLDINFLYLTGYAGHGKDTAKRIAEENFTNDFKAISMAETLKLNACSLILPEHRDLVGFESDIDVLNNLKDNFPDLKFFANMTTRVFLQKLGTEFYRHLNDSIHTTFVASKILEELNYNKRDDIIFAASDIRFPNELEFMLKLSQIKGEDLKDYLRFLSKSVANTLPQNDKIIEHFEHVYGVSRNETSTKKIIDSVIYSVEKLKTVSDYNKEWNLQVPRTQDMKKEDAIKYGFLNVFRPILNPKNIYSKKMKAQEIVEEIKTYTGLEYGKVADIMKYYKASELDFTAENVVKYGFLRADIRHPSENSVNHLKPEPILSTPLRDNKFDKELLELYSLITVKDEVVIDNKKKNLINRGIK